MAADHAEGAFYRHWRAARLGNSHTVAARDRAGRSKIDAIAVLPVRQYCAELDAIGVAADALLHDLIIGSAQGKRCMRVARRDLDRNTGSRQIDVQARRSGVRSHTDGNQNRQACTADHRKLLVMCSLTMQWRSREP